MIDIDQELNKYNLTREKYELCLADIKGKINGQNDMDWAEIVDKYNLGIHGDTLRKASQTIFGGAFITEYMSEKNKTDKASEGYMAELKTQKRDIRLEREKLHTEKLEYNKWLREHARDELICERICDEIKALQPLEAPCPIDYPKGKTEAVLCFADTHYGTEFSIKGLYGNVLNEYSPEIFERRMLELLVQTLRVITEKGLTHIHIFSLGDELDGILRVSQLMKLRYGVIEATVKYSEYISNWLNELSNYVHIDFYSVQGNHTELRMLGQPKGTFTNDNMTTVINQFIKVRLSDNPNFTFHENESGLIFENICGYNVLGIHGEVKNMSASIQSFSNTYNVMIDVLVGAHKHHLSMETIGQNREVISVPSVIGIDDYAMSLGKTSNPGALLFFIEEGKGIVEQRNFKL